MSTENKVKLPFRSAFSVGDKSPKTPPVGLLLSHGKPNFTINRNGNAASKSASPSPPPPETANVCPFEPKVILRTPSPKIVKSAPTWVPSNSGPNEASKVVLRKTQFSAPKVEEASEPEFIVAQRRMAEKLSSKDLEQLSLNRNSYRTEMLMTPTSDSRQQRPMEFPLPPAESSKVVVEEVKPVEEIATVEEVKQIDEAVEEAVKAVEDAVKEVEPVEVVPVVQEPVVEVPKEESIAEPKEEVLPEVPTTHEISKETGEVEPKDFVADLHKKSPFVQQLNQMIAQGTLAQAEAVSESYPAPEPEAEVPTIENNNQTAVETNFEAKTVTSFSKDLSSEPNKYPDTVVVTTEVPASDQNGNELIDEMAKLKFDIQSSENDLTVTPIIVRGE